MKQLREGLHLSKVENSESEHYSSITPLEYAQLRRKSNKL